MDNVERDEENVVTVEVREGMTKEEIMDLVLQRVEGDLPLKEDPSSNLCTTLSNTLNMARIRCKLDLDYHCNCIKMY